MANVIILIISNGHLQEMAQSFHFILFFCISFLYQLISSFCSFVFISLIFFICVVFLQKYINVFFKFF